LAFDEGDDERFVPFSGLRMLANALMAVKPFDIDLNWMSKFRNQEKAAFWMADDDDGMSPPLNNTISENLTTNHNS
jgi:hypothetical protein